MRYFIYLSYDGSGYHGWQIQPNGSSIQAELNRAVTILCRVPTEVTGAGRTDTGVNASMMVAHFDSSIPMPDNVADKMNRILPQDISIHKVVRVRDDAHARFSALSRTYRYFIHQNRNPFNRQYSFLVTYPLDFKLMNEASDRLLSFDDFTSFAKLHTDTKTNICKVTYAQWNEKGCFTIKANRFLRNMVRAIVGTLLDVGRGRISVEEFCDIVERRDRCSAGMSVPGNALFLADIEYPDDIFMVK